MTEWQPEPRPVDPELTDTFVHATYPPERTHFPTIAEKLGAATVAELLAVMGGQPTWRDTEIGGE